MKPTIVFFALLLSMILRGPVVYGQQPPSTLENELERVTQATVFVIQARAAEDTLVMTCFGSGTLVSSDGLVLTNAHNVVTSDDCPGDTILIALGIRFDEPPVPLYRAQINQAEPGLDLAVLRITQDASGRQLPSDALSLPFVEIANSDTVELDDNLVVVGYPDIGNNSVAVERGTVSGFTAEPSGDDRAWIKTSASIPGMMSGGGAYDREGRLIAIPTTAPPTRMADDTACRIIQDTNRDGFVNQNDDCVPLGGFINALRPSNFARPLVQAASLDLTVEIGLQQNQTTTTVSDEPTFSRLFFSPSVNDAGMPTRVISGAPTGTNSLYLYFDYANMTPETVYELRIARDNIPDPNLSLAPVRWSGGTSGLWYIGSTGIPWPSGVYEFTMFIDGIAAATANIVIGGAPTTEPQMSDIVFGLSDLEGNVIGNGFVLPTGSIASARFIFRNMVDGTDWTAIWYYQGAEIFRTLPPNLWADGANGAKTISIQDPNQLLPGVYRLELYVGNNLTATADFTIAGAQQGAFPLIFEDAHFATADSPAEAIGTPASSGFTTNIDNLYFLFDWQQIEPGTPWTIRWLVDDAVFFEQVGPWQATNNGLNFLSRLTRPGGLPDGTYSVSLFVGQVQIASATAQVGIGQLPIDTFAQAGGLQLQGQIVDANTLDGLPGVTFVLISEDFSVEDFVWDQEQIYALATTDRNGRFQIDRPLELSTDEADVPYSVIISAEGYVPLTADGFIVTAEDDNPLDLTIYMTRD